MSEEENASLYTYSADIEAASEGELSSTLIGKLRSFCPNFYFKLLAWERDFLENSVSLNIVTSNEFARISMEALVSGLQPTVPVDNPPVSPIVDHPSSLPVDANTHTPLVKLPLTMSGQQETIGRAAILDSLVPTRSDSDSPTQLPIF
jgi:hypothetical protein